MRKDSRFLRACGELTPDQIAVRIAILEGRAALLGHLAVMPGPLGGWAVHDVGSEYGQHTVLADLSSCSCPDNRFRKHECKHIAALKAWLKPGGG